MMLNFQQFIFQLLWLLKSYWLVNFVHCIHMFANKIEDSVLVEVFKMIMIKKAHASKTEPELLIWKPSSEVVMSLDISSFKVAMPILFDVPFILSHSAKIISQAKIRKYSSFPVLFILFKQIKSARHSTVSIIPCSRDRKHDKIDFIVFTIASASELDHRFLESRQSQK